MPKTRLAVAWTFWIGIAAGAPLQRSMIDLQPEAGLSDGIAQFQRGEYNQAARTLEAASQTCVELCDYVRYHWALSLSTAGGPVDAIRILTGFEERFPRSELRSKAARLRVEGLIAAGRSEEAGGVVGNSSHLLRRPLHLWLLARAAQAGGDRVAAVKHYRQIYVRHPASEFAGGAARALVQLDKRKIPALPATERMARADNLFERGRYEEARREYSRIGPSPGTLQEKASVRAGACYARMGRTAQALRTLQSLKPKHGASSAERIFYLAECLRRTGNQQAFLAGVERLGRQHRHSLFYQEALWSAGNYFLARNDSARAAAFFERLVKDFPAGPHSARAHWHVCWNAYVQGSGWAKNLFQEHLRLHPRGSQTSAALYWWGRLAENASDTGTARELYATAIHTLPNHFYTFRAQERLKALPRAATGRTPARRPALTLPLAPTPTVAPHPSPDTAWRIRRSRLLRALSLHTLAEESLRSLDPPSADAHWIGIELAEQAAAQNEHHQAIRTLKRFAAGYLSHAVDSLPRRFWELMFPLPWEVELTQEARRQGLDPYLLAALIRQESEFNPAAVSRAGARGLMQIMPATGSSLARKAGLEVRSSPALLHNPRANVRLGTLYLRDLITQFEGALEAALAGYNAGPSRARRWKSGGRVSGPEEFIESIPFRETREYVAAVLRNAEIYRRLYGPATAGDLARATLSE
jgi:soluble lytic murein transglycosylase